MPRRPGQWGYSLPGAEGGWDNVAFVPRWPLGYAPHLQSTQFKLSVQAPAPTVPSSPKLDSLPYQFRLALHFPPPVPPVQIPSPTSSGSQSPQFATPSSPS